MRYLAALAVGLAAAAGAEPSVPSQQARAVLKEMIEVDTAGDAGTTVLAEKIAARFRAAGWPAADVQLLAPADKPHKGNLVVRLRGSGKGKPVLWMAHIDVVTARPEDWTLPPFKLTERDGYFYGRGTHDMKGDSAAAVDALLTLRAEGWKPKRDIILALTADEEGGDGNGVDFLLKSHPNAFDPEMIINVDAGGLSLKNGKPVYYGLQTSEKIYVTYQAETTSAGGHSSRPTADNPIYGLAHALVGLEKLKFPVNLTDTAKLYFARAAAFASADDAADMRALAATGDAAAAARLSAKVEHNVVMRTTCVATMAEAGHAENALPQRARATIQCRVIPGESDASVRAAITAALGDRSISLTNVWPLVPSPESPPTAARLKTIETTARTLWPGIVVVPFLEAGATDGVYTRNAGIPTYGASGIAIDIDDIRAHGRDERIRVESFDRAVIFNYRMMKAFGGQ